jgi:hypothetical protein
MANTQIDPRGPRFGAAITATALAATIYLGLDSASEPLAFAILSSLTVLFAIGAVFGTQRHPYAWLFKTFVRPRLAAPKELEDSTPPQFAQAVGLFVAGTGVVLHLAGVEYGLVWAAAAAFVASFLNAAFNYCLGCQMYLGLKRLKVIR